MSAVGALSGVGGIGNMHMFNGSAVSGVTDLSGSGTGAQEMFD